MRNGERRALSPSELIVFPDRTFRRTGECNGCLGLARCCTYVMLPLARALSEDEKRWVELHPGLRIEGESVRIDIPCSALRDGKCSIHSSRPRVCQNYPEWPDLDEGCSYKFERIK